MKQPANKTTTTDLATIDSFQIVDRYAGMDEEARAELMDEMGDFSEESGLIYKTIKVPSGGTPVFVISDGGEDEDTAKEIEGVIIYTHRLNGYWPFAMGSGPDGDKAPTCSSMDGKTGVNRETGEIKDCEKCPLNQFGTSRDGGKGKACKNMRRMYIIRNGDPNLYMLSVPPTSMRDVNKQLVKIMGGKGIPYTGLLIGLKLQKATNANGISYSKVVLENRGVLPSAAATTIRAMRAEVKRQYQEAAITPDDYQVDQTTAPANLNGFTDVSPDEIPY